MQEIYLPAEDSYFLSELLRKEIKISKKDKILDMGAGTGIQSEALICLGANPKNITLVDINKKAIKYLKDKFLKSKIIHSNLFSKIKGRFDLIVFNPPYLPEDKREPKSSRISTTGGKDGSEIINKFLKQSKKHLKKDGKIILLTSNLTKGIDFFDYPVKLLGRKKIFYEELLVWEISLK